MAGIERDLFTLDELADQAGTYFNPHTEVVIVVDDSAAVDPEGFEIESDGETEWVRVSDELPVDEQRRDEILEDYAATYRPSEPIDDFDEVDEIEPDPDPDE